MDKVLGINKGKLIEISEGASKKEGNFYDVTTSLCYLNEYNLNGIRLIGETLDDNIKTLLNTPVVAYME
ncbi:unnamed protein product, partial [marine sediment metagenome]